jgi:hypothetical protein
MTVQLRRGDDLSDDSVVLIHMGAGAPLSVARAALRNFSDYVGVRSEGSGLFTISVFAVTAGVSEAEITGAFDHNQFGRSTYGMLRKAGVDLIATTIIDDEMAPGIRAIQRVHYDIVLGVPFAAAAIPNVDREVAQLTEAVTVAATKVLDLFVPRLRKPPSRGRTGG